MSLTLDWVSSMRVRLGYLVTQTLLAYGTAGGAWGKLDYAASNFAPSIPPPPYATSTAFSTTQGGWDGGRRARMGDDDQLAVEGRISVLQSRRCPVAVGPGRQLSRISVGLFLEQYQCGGWATRLELQILNQTRASAPFVLIDPFGEPGSSVAAIWDDLARTSTTSPGTWLCSRLGPGMLCTKCRTTGADARPNWKERVRA
jgi:hypothetical protein